MQKGEQTKNSKEWIRIKSFAAGCGLFKEEEINRGIPPEPDFIVGDNNIIGIEVTDLYVPLDDVGFFRKQYENESEIITQLAEEEFTKLNTGQELEVHVTFTDYSGTILHKPEFILQKADRAVLARAIVEAVAFNLPQPGERVSIYRWDEYGEKVLPDKINHISVTNRTGQWEGYWSPTFGGSVPGLQKNHIDDVLKKKNSRPKNYKLSYKEIWLLMVLNAGSYSSYFHLDKISDFKEELFETTFDKLFVFHLWDKDVVQLKTKK